MDAAPELTELMVVDLLAGAKLLLAALDRAEPTLAQNWCEHGELVRECPVCTPEAQLLIVTPDGEEPEGE